MPTVTTQYRMFVPRRRRISPGAMVDILPPTVNLVSGDYAAIAPDTIEVHYPTPTDDLRPATFAFWSVRGSADGEYTLRDETLVAHTSSDPMSATAWYCLGSGSGTNGGRSELETDAFLVDEDTFVDPTPIANVTPADAWDHSDVSEFVFTDEEGSDVLALDSVVDVAEHFEHWFVLEGGASAVNGTLQVPQKDNGIAIATYRIPPPVTPPRHIGSEGEIAGTIVGGVAHDGSGGIIINGHFHPIGPWDPLLSGIAVFNAARGLQPEMRTRVQREALRAIGSYAAHLEGALKGEAVHAG